MAWTITTVEQIERVAKKFAEAGERLRELVEQMRQSECKQIYTQIASADSAARRASSFAVELSHHLPNQIECQQTGETPDWQITQRRSAMNRARKEAKENVERLGIIKKPAKKPKKKGA